MAKRTAKMTAKGLEGLLAGECRHGKSWSGTTNFKAGAS
jgi:hypothetical protein